MAEDNKELVATRKQLKINTGVVKEEVEEQKRKVDKYIAGGKDDYDIKNQQTILAESEKMIPDTQERIESAVGKLREIVVTARSTLGSDEELVQAEEALEEANIQEVKWVRRKQGMKEAEELQTNPC